MALPISYNVRNLRERWQVTFLAVRGISLVVAVLVVLLAMSAGCASPCARPASRERDGRAARLG